MKDEPKSPTLEDYKEILGTLKSLKSLSGNMDGEDEELSRLEYLISIWEETRKISNDLSLVDEMAEAGLAITQGHTDLSEKESAAKIKDLEMEQDRINIESGKRIASMMEELAVEPTMQKKLKKMVNEYEKDRAEEIAKHEKIITRYKKLNQEVKDLAALIPKQTAKERKKSAKRMKEIG